MPRMSPSACTAFRPCACISRQPPLGYLTVMHTTVVCQRFQPPVLDFLKGGRQLVQDDGESHGASPGVISMGGYGAIAPSESTGRGLQ